MAETKTEANHSNGSSGAPATKAPSPTPEETVTKTEAKETSALAVAKNAEMQPSGSIWNRPVGPGQIEVAESISVAGVRPIAASHMEIFGTILNDRPIQASHIQVADTTIPGGRPIFTSEIVIRDDLTLPGGRPIFASDARLMDAPLLPGGRPIADNELEDGELLMGYID
ncbi:hypothetical protein NDI52_23165 [Leptolyngbya sp. PL-A3]|uniref:hypothetical protein n=1 Tax=Leptolyngbya sp. FACHB-8 TaxID=2692814 RepID=UPI001A7E669E|nr:hypothetical protein [Leptolyngbya sp. FACHB-8]